jgi:hypothetical protein
MMRARRRLPGDILALGDSRKLPRNIAKTPAIGLSRELSLDSPSRMVIQRGLEYLEITRGREADERIRRVLVG